jgi:hypothetical protein
MTRNFLIGYADQQIFDTKGIDTRGKARSYPPFAWLRKCYRQARQFKNSFKKILFWPILFIYPIPYKLGRLFYTIYKIRKSI